jgi:membrane-associated phospholipid phosphatase
MWPPAVRPIFRTIKFLSTTAVKNFSLFTCVAALLIAPVSGRAEEKQQLDLHLNTHISWTAAASHRGYELWQTVVSDHKNFYSLHNAALFAAGLSVAAVTANTAIDGDIRDWYQDSVRSGTTDNVAKVVKNFGEWHYTVPAFFGVAVLGELTSNTKPGSIAGEWAERCLRITLLGAPPTGVFQLVLGSSRPEEGSSHWRPFHDNNGVSGHAFIGAIPFLAAATMTDNPYLKYPLYVASTFTALSRINDNAHYFSQALLGWWISFLAAQSVDRTDLQKRNIVIAPAMGSNTIGIVVAMQF